MQIYKIIRKDWILYVYRRHHAVCKNWRTGDSDTNNEKIEPVYRNGICHLKMIVCFFVCLGLMAYKPL